MPPQKPHTTAQIKPSRFSRLSSLAARNPLVISRLVLPWTIVGIVSGLFAGLYWYVLEQMTRRLQVYEGPSLLIVMPLAGLVVGLVIHFLGNPGEIAVIVDNIHFRGGRLDPRKNPAMILASLASISAGGSAGPEAPLVQVTGSFGTWLADRLRIEGENLRTMSLVRYGCRLHSPIWLTPWRRDVRTGDSAPSTAALNAAVTRTPVSTTLLLTKLTGFSPLTPILFASLIGFFLAPKAPLIKSQLESHPEELAD